MKDEQYILHVYLTGELKDALERYLKNQYPDSRGTTITIRKALREFFTKEGYIGGDKDVGQQH